MDRLIDDKTGEILKDIFSQELVNPIEVVIHTNGGTELSVFAVEFLSELGSFSDKVILKKEAFSPSPSLAVDPSIQFGENLGYKVLFSGTPAGQEANTVIETIRILSRGFSGFSEESAAALKKIDKTIKIQIFVTPTCPYCPQAAHFAIRAASVLPEKISVEIIEAQENEQLSREFNVSSVPQFVINGDKKTALIGVHPEAKMLDYLLEHGSSQFHEHLKEKEEKIRQSLILPDEPDTVLTLNEANFEEASKKYPKLVVDCWAEWCGPCRMISPIIEALSKEYKGRLVFGKMNTDENPGLSAKLEISSIPCILTYQDGEIKEKLIGAKPKEKLESELARIYSLLIL